METTQQLKVRRSIRLPEYDYSMEGYYFITICTYNRQCLLGKVIEGKAKLNPAGRLVKTVWQNLENKFQHLCIDEFIVMPNHLHGVLAIESDIAKTSVARIVSKFKRTVVAEYANKVRNQNWPAYADKLWQRNYYEHVIRNDTALSNIREYIYDNPIKWHLDENNPVNIN